MFSTLGTSPLSHSTRMTTNARSRSPDRKILGGLFFPDIENNLGFYCYFSEFFHRYRTFEPDLCGTWVSFKYDSSGLIKLVQWVIVTVSQRRTIHWLTGLESRNDASPAKRNFKKTVTRVWYSCQVCISFESDTFSLYAIMGTLFTKAWIGSSSVKCPHTA